MPAYGSLNMCFTSAPEQATLMNVTDECGSLASMSRAASESPDLYERWQSGSSFQVDGRPSMMLGMSPPMMSIRSLMHPGSNDIPSSALDGSIAWPQTSSL